MTGAKSSPNVCAGPFGAVYDFYSAPRGVMSPGGLRGPPPVTAMTGRSWGQSGLEVKGSGGSSPDDVPTGRRQRPGRASKAERHRETEPVVEAPQFITSPETGGCGLSRCSSSVVDGGRLARALANGAREAVRCVAVPHGDAAGVKLDADPAYRCMMNVGSVPAVPTDPVGVRAGAPSAVAAGAWRRDRITRRSGKPATWGRVPANAQHAWRKEVASEHRRAAARAR